MNEQLYDVIVYEIATGRVYNIVGKGLTERKADRRQDTMLSRMNERYDAEIVETGKYTFGDVYKNSEVGR